MSRLKNVNEDAAQWIIRQEDGDWSDDDQSALDAWLEESDSHKASYWRMLLGWQEADRIGALGLASQESESSKRFHRKGWWVPAALAASLLATLGLGVMTQQSWRELPVLGAEARFETPVGGRKVFGLADGSKVELNTGSTLYASVTRATREVWLSHGEAYFEISHIEGRPFVVHAGSRNVTVLGTKFSVRRLDDQVTVSVVEGRVRVDDANKAYANRSAVISAGDIAVTKGAATSVTTKSTALVQSALAWREGILSFDQATVADVAAEFNRYNSKPITVTDTEAAKMLIGGIFPTTNPDAFVRLLRDAYGLHVQENDDAIKISSR